MLAATVLAIVGLVVIIIAWIVQLITILGKSKTLSLFFVWLHLIGVLFVIIGNIGFKSLTAVVLNLILAIITIFILILYPGEKEVKNE
ncbi:MAG: hypothetical protein KAU01_10600 [Candidatus Cloacimonetes bacterium]|nr:hypothetical protein [Candidatus Cloacimonadota bacterium]